MNPFPHMFRTAQPRPLSIWFTKLDREVQRANCKCSAGVSAGSFVSRNGRVMFTNRHLFDGDFGKGENEQLDCKNETQISLLLISGNSDPTLNGIWHKYQFLPW